MSPTTWETACTPLPLGGALEAGEQLGSRQIAGGARGGIGSAGPAPARCQWQDQLRGGRRGLAPGVIIVHRAVGQCDAFTQPGGLGRHDRRRTCFSGAEVPQEAHGRTYDHAGDIRRAPGGDCTRQDHEAAPDQQAYQRQPETDVGGGIGPADGASGTSQTTHDTSCTLGDPDGWSHAPTPADGSLRRWLQQPPPYYTGNRCGEP